MKRSINALLVVDAGDNSLTMLNEAVCEYLEAKGFSVSVPHVFQRDPIVIEIKETIPFPHL